jgi:hypothetical protein
MAHNGVMAGMQVKPERLSKTQRASARLDILPTPSVIIRDRGTAEQSLLAEFPVTHTGPYDAIFD